MFGRRFQVKNAGWSQSSDRKIRFISTSEKTIWCKCQQTLFFSCKLVNMTMTLALSSQTILQKSLNVAGRGPKINENKTIN